MRDHARCTSLLAGVILCSACSTSSLGPEPPAAVMLGEWSYAAPIRIVDPPALNTGLQVQVRIDSVEGMRFWGRVTLWFAGDAGTALSAFGRVAGRIDDTNGVSLEIPRGAPVRSAVMVRGELAGDVLTVRECHSGADAGPFASGTAFERVSTR